jgi:DNA-directed RNA polymerase subunit omega
MIHPSYVEMMKVINNDVEIGEEPVVNSRYSLVIATAKRARQLIDGDEPLADKIPCDKPLSIAVEEIYEQKVKILPEDAVIEDYYSDSLADSRTTFDYGDDVSGNDISYDDDEVSDDDNDDEESKDDDSYDEEEIFEDEASYDDDDDDITDDKDE